MVMKPACSTFVSRRGVTSTTLRASQPDWLKNVLFCYGVGMNKNQGPTKDDVARLIRGKPSKSRCGSRQIRHRLRNDELERLSIARSRGFLAITPSTRNALKNAWHLDRLAASKPCVFVQHITDGYTVFGEKNGTPFSAVVNTFQQVEDLLHATVM